MSALRRSRLWVTVAATSLAALLAACGSGGANGGSGTGDTASPVRVGVITSLSGPLSDYGKQVQDGLRAGLACSTNGTNAVNGHPVTFDVKDDGGDAATAQSLATGMVGEGITILTGSANSGIAPQLGQFAQQQGVLYIASAVGSDKLTGLNANTFRATRQASQEAMALTSVLPGGTGKVAVLAQDYALGQGYVASIKKILPNAQVEPVLVPLDAREFTPYAQKVASLKPDLLVVVYYGDTAAAVWQSLLQQGVTDTTPIASLLGQRSSWGIYGAAAPKITFVAHDFAGQDTRTATNDCLLKESPNADESTFNGFVSAQMIVHALTVAGADDVEGMKKALDGYSFEAPKGKVTIRSGDHALIQDMLVVSLTTENGKPTAKLVKTVPAADLTP
ncbi:ABC transporter substrate-binding protein [Pseudonocardia ailaonensis]|uniref:ABC transporter substrate-binding protein n=1 Tax=Pseudonocardia ailaonensis TaxID=367279 RepID=A0ABN2N3H3_9PSEU